ncbi:hypothetical protein [Paenibacillus eucommiae]|uniref:Uncharacterized protein n=1 Tax=Paenibacillus eucommiae TaxID=1355755 RepID=A0ABS4IRX2_9BACL|nr:hypothetical protein [Paenibacillus eucommiae]MBP1990290.1 hypothetical protein [Paenibacillus eucommiae]
MDKGDFDIKKGCSYNTGIHNIKGKTLLYVQSGRKQEDLRTYAQYHQDFLQMTPKRCDGLVKAYHNGISLCFSGQFEFSVTFIFLGYVIEALL